MKSFLSYNSNFLVGVKCILLSWYNAKCKQKVLLVAYPYEYFPTTYETNSLESSSKCAISYGEQHLFITNVIKVVFCW